MDFLWGILTGFLNRGSLNPSWDWVLFQHRSPGTLNP